MKHEEDNIAGLLKRSLPSAEQVEAAGSRVFERLLMMRTEDSTAALPDHEGRSCGRRRRPMLVIAVAAAAVMACSFSIVLVMNGSWKKGDGDQIRSGPEGRILVLRDGSRVEMRSQSQLQVHQADDGVRLHLNEGSVIVTAAKQGAGHLYVETKDVIVSVVGTVFIVSAQQAGSRIGVLQGIVNVQHGAFLRTLQPGQQMATSAIMEPVSLEEQVSWSQHAAEHVALLQQFIPSAQPQSPAAPAFPRQNAVEERNAFEVVAVRPGSAGRDGSGRGGAMPSGFGCGGSFLQVDPAHLTVSANVLTLVAMAYGKNCIAMRKHDLFGGGPSWVTSEQFTVQATLPDGSAHYSPRQLIESHAPQLEAMLRTLLADRFKLSLRREAKVLSVYALTVAKGGPKLTPFQEGTCDAVAPLTPEALKPGQTPPCLQGFNVNRKSHFNVTANGVTLDRFADVLSDAFDRPVVNKTGISGTFDLHLESAMDFTMFCKEPPNCNNLLGTPSDSPPLVFDAIQQQLGLRLESTKAPVETLVIDHVEKPSEN